jgi:hypothetical protein
MQSLSYQFALWRARSESYFRANLFRRLPRARRAGHRQHGLLLQVDLRNRIRSEAVSARGHRKTPVAIRIRPSGGAAKGSLTPRRQPRERS